jgi:hypothetical protein
MAKLPVDFARAQECMGAEGSQGLHWKGSRQRSGWDFELRKGAPPMRSEWLDENAVMVGSVPCKLSSEVHING